MLVPLLEGNTLSVPGHGDVIKAAPGFRLFATQRFVTIVKSVCIKLTVMFVDFVFTFYVVWSFLCQYFEARTCAKSPNVLEFVCLLKFARMFLNFTDVL